VREFCAKLREVLALASPPRLLLQAKSSSAPLVLLDDRKPIGTYYTQYRDTKDGLLHVALLFEADRDDSASTSQSTTAGTSGASALSAAAASPVTLASIIEDPFVPEPRERPDRRIANDAYPVRLGAADERRRDGGTNGRKGRTGASAKRDEAGGASRRRAGGSS